MEIFLFLLAPFVASLILTGIHAYLGVHVVERGVIFVDLALAQIAALGATVAIVVGMDPHGRGSYWISLGFTFLGAAIFAFARTRRGHIPQEAFIGIAYSVASALLINRMAMAEATEYAIPIKASCGMCPRRVRAKAKIAAPRKVKPKLIQYEPRPWGSIPTTMATVAPSAAI